MARKLLEHTYSRDVVIDEEGHVIRGVKLLGKESKNGYDYSDKALQEAVSLFEGIKVNVDHPDRTTPSSERKMLDSPGWISNVSWKTDGLYGDFNYLESHPASQITVEWAKRNPRGIGFSQNAQGTMAPGGRCVESIDKVRSLDLVGCPATTEGLFESVNEEPKMTTTTIRKLIESHGSNDQKKRLDLFEDMPEATAVLDRDVEVDEVEDGIEKQLAASFEQHILADAETGIDPVLVAKRAVMKGEVPKVEEPEPEEATLESLKEEVALMKATDSVRSLMESHNVQQTGVRVKALVGLSQDDQITLIEDWKTSGRPERSGSRAPSGESSYDEVTKEVKEQI